MIKNYLQCHFFIQSKFICIIFFITHKSLLNILFFFFFSIRNIYHSLIISFF
jgi:hypothetical protein